MTPLELVQRGYEAFAKGDVPGIVALYSADATFTPQMGLEGKAPLVTPKGTFRTDELSGFFAALSKEIEFTAWENRQWVVDGNTVVVLGYYAGKNKRTNKMFASEFAHVLTVSDDKVMSFKEFTDTAALLASSTPFVPSAAQLKVAAGRSLADLGCSLRQMREDLLR
jgi:ketosteroid isomerase-like protein